MNQKKVLVCDDDEGILSVVEIILVEEGFKVLTVSSGEKIRRVIDSFQPDIILLDIMMSGINGREVTKILKKEKETSKIPIIILSALNDLQRIARDIGADSFLPKPFEIEDLVAKVKQYTK